MFAGQKPRNILVPFEKKKQLSTILFAPCVPKSNMEKGSGTEKQLPTYLAAIFICKHIWYVCFTH